MPRTLLIESTGGPLPLFDSEGPPDAASAVIVFQEAFGVNPHIEDVTQRFAGAGYRAVAPHLFHRSGDPVIDYSKVELVMPHMELLTEEGLLSDLDATLDYLAALGFGQAHVGVVGFCMGGSVTFLAAARRTLGAAVTFYGGGVKEGRFGMPALVELAPELKTPWLGLFGDLDQGIPVADVELLRIEAAKSDVPAEIVRYREADHGFHCDARPSYHAPSAADAWDRTLRWFETRLHQSDTTRRPTQGAFQPEPPGERSPGDGVA
jgi:carboxymethylenebutenolidase